VSVTRCWLTPPAAMVMDMVDTIDSFLCMVSGHEAPGKPRPHSAEGRVRYRGRRFSGRLAQW
jgi:hypothetical protein